MVLAKMVMETWIHVLFWHGSQGHGAHSAGQGAIRNLVGVFDEWEVTRPSQKQYPLAPVPLDHLTQ